MDSTTLLHHRSRLVVEPDFNPLNPRVHMESPCGVLPGQIWNRDLPILYEFPGDLTRAIEYLMDWDRPLDPEHNVQRWAWSYYGLHVERVDRDWWFCDREQFDAMIGKPFTRENQAEIVKQEATAWRRFADGEAVTVSLERRATFKRVSNSRVDAKDLLHIWEPVRDGQIGDVYLEDYEGSVAQVAADHFAHLLNNDERAVIQAMTDSERVLSSTTKP